MNSKKPTICLSSSSHIRFRLYILLMFLSLTVISALYGDGNKTDHQALLMFKSLITQNSQGALSSWNHSRHFCDWDGVFCGKRHKRRVVKLRLNSKGLEGYLSPHLGNLSFLRGLYLWRNNFHGDIPHELGRLSRLRVLNLEQNNFIGFIPANISRCSNLEVLRLNNNKLVGGIPKEISVLSKLIHVSLSDNSLKGGIPPFMGNFTSMQQFYITNNPLGGSIPDTLGNWKDIQELYAGGCNLSGTIPHSLYNLSFLSVLSLGGNQLMGSLPPDIMLPQLVALILLRNQLSGPLPPSISNCSILEYLEMHDNKITGKLTLDFAKLKNIVSVLLFNNNLGSKEADEMKFIDSLKNCSSLLALFLSNCKFQGVLPISIGNLSNNLKILDLQCNRLYGNLPESIGNLVGLSYLLLGSNQFTGNIPSTIGNLQKLGRLYLAENQFSGQIPVAIGNLSMLLDLDLSSNILEGNIPASLGNCHKLLEVHLQDNELNGKIPFQLLQLSSLSKELDLSRNNLSGSLPDEVGDLKMLTYLTLSYNKLSGNIPRTLGGCTSLTGLSLNGNKFQGVIPSSLGSLKGLSELDVSNNNFSGQIPRFLEQMHVLEYLNLSYNDFEGEIPMLGVFANASKFSVVGNNMLCGGIVELGLSKCKETKKRTKKVRFFMIGILISFTLVTIICLTYAWCKKKSKSESPQSPTREQFMKVTYKQLLKATDGFSEATLIGKGGFSSVYKGILHEDDDRFVAVKVLHLHNRGAQKSFMRECEAWRNIRHRNILKMITLCSSVDFQENDFKALVYEFMSNGSLHDRLHSSDQSTSKLNLVQRINILMGVACALDYIHNQCEPTIVHGDLKPSNILLDDDMVAHVGDFGLARFLVTTSYQNSSTVIRGTIGYAAPEYGLGNEMTSAGDVYSFGVLLLEVMTGKSPTDEIFNEGLSLHKFASMALPDKVIDVIDVNIFLNDEIITQTKKIEECLGLTIKIGVSCSMDAPSQRMNMKSVVKEFHHILHALQNI